MYTYFMYNILCKKFKSITAEDLAVNSSKFDAKNIVKKTFKYNLHN